MESVGPFLDGGTQPAEAVCERRDAVAFLDPQFLGAAGPSTIEDAGAADVSYPEFFTILDSLRA